MRRKLPPKDPDRRHSARIADFINSIGHSTMSRANTGRHPGPGAPPATTARRSPASACGNSPCADREIELAIAEANMMDTGEG